MSVPFFMSKRKSLLKKEKPISNPSKSSPRSAPPLQPVLRQNFRVHTTKRNPIVFYTESSVYSVTLVAITVTYNNIGSFEVRLRVTNLAGANETSRVGYINIDDNIATQNCSSDLAFLKVYPNPGTPQAQILVDFHLNNSLYLNFFLFDDAGKQVKHLMRHRSKAGKDRLSFKAKMLPTGHYVLVLQDQQNKLVGSHKLVVVD